MPYPRLPALTDESLRILTLLAEGHTVEAIAHQVEHGPRTVRRRLVRLLEETGCRSYTHLAVWATTYGLVEPELPTSLASEFLEHTRWRLDDSGRLAFYPVSLPRSSTQ